MSELLHSTLSVLLFCGILYLLPVRLAYDRLFGIPRWTLCLAVLGVYLLAGRVRPLVLPPWSLWLVAVGAALAVRLLRRGAREPLLDPLRIPAAWVVILFSFSLFAWRWEPPGDASAGLGAYARDILDGRIRGQGVPLVAAVAGVGQWAPVERLLGFLNGYSLALFVFAVSSVLGLWFTRQAALGGAAAALLVLGSPRDLWLAGEAPALLGMTGGLVLLDFGKLLWIRRVSPWEAALYGLALVAGASADGVAFAASLLFCAPALAWLWLNTPNRRRLWRPFAAVGGFALCLALPGLPAVKLGLGNPWPVLSAVLGERALWLVLALGFVVPVVERRQKFLLPAAASLLWGLLWLPTGGTSTLFALPLAMPLAWLVDVFLKETGALVRVLCGAAFGILGALSLHLLYGDLGPQFRRTTLTLKNREAMEYVARFLPERDCVGIQGAAGRWIPALTSRCVTSYPADAPPKWLFVAEGEPKPALAAEDPVFSGAAVVYRLED